MKNSWPAAISRLHISVAVAVVLISPIRAFALDLTQKFAFDIPPQRLASALIEFSRQARVQVVVGKEVDDRKTAGVRGKRTVAEALATLLKGSSLTFLVIGDTAISIGAASQEAEAKMPIADGKEREKPSSERFRMAQVDRGGLEGPAAVDPRSGQPQPQPSLSEIIVTAQKYNQPAFDVPMSLAVIGGAALDRMGVTNLDDMRWYVPGLAIDDQGQTQRISIRGVSNVYGQGALVGTYLDEADVTAEEFYAVNLGTYDLQRVEVLRGPQGTLYGEGSLGGTIRYITNRPALDSFQLTANLDGLFDQYGAPGERMVTVLNTPIVAQVLGLRVAIDLDHEGGWVDQPADNLKNINTKDLTEVRMEGRWRLASDLTVDATEVIHRETLGPTVGEDDAGHFLQQFGLTTTPSIDDSYNVSNLTTTLGTNRIELVNSVTYFTHESHQFNQGSSYQYTPPPSPKVSYYYADSVAKDESLSDELRLSDGGSGLWRWTLGGFYRHFTDESPPSEGYYAVPGPPESPLPAPFTTFSDVGSKSVSAFADTSIQLLGRLVVGAGIRDFMDDARALETGDTYTEARTFTSVDPRFYVRLRVSRQVNVYASAAKGFRSGGFNGDGAANYGPEHVWTYEVGTKARLWGGRLAIDADTFLSNYGGYQIVGVLPPPNIPIDITRNAGTVRIKGIEGDLAWSPSDRWRVGLSGDYINGRLVDLAVVDSPIEVGDPLDFVARYQITASAEQSFVWQGRASFARIEYSQQAREPYRAVYLGPWYYSQSNYTYLLNFEAGIAWSDSLRFRLSAENLLNDRGYTGPDVIEELAPRMAPRTFGIGFSFNLQ